MNDLIVLKSVKDAEFTTDSAQSFCGSVVAFDLGKASSRPMFLHLGRAKGQNDVACHKVGLKSLVQSRHKAQ